MSSPSHLLALPLVGSLSPLPPRPTPPPSLGFGFVFLYLQLCWVFEDASGKGWQVKIQFSLVEFASHGVKCSFPQGLGHMFTRRK